MNEELSKQTGQPVKVVGIYIKAFWYSVRMSIKDFTPVHIHGFLDFNIHKWIFKKKIKGERLPMPDGISEAILRSQIETPNSRRVKGSAMKYVVGSDICVGVVVKQIGGNDLLVKRLLTFTKQGRRLVITENIPFEERLTPENYNPRGSVYTWLQRNLKKMSPPMSMRMLKRVIGGG